MSAFQSSSLCLRLLDLPFWVLVFLNKTGPLWSPSEVMTRSLNFCLGSGGSSGVGVEMISSTCGNCKSTLALKKKSEMVYGLQAAADEDHCCLERLTRDPFRLWSVPKIRMDLLLLTFLVVSRIVSHSLVPSAQAQLVSFGPLPLFSPPLHRLLEHLHLCWHLPPFLRTLSQLSFSESKGIKLIKAVRTGICHLTVAVSLTLKLIFGMLDCCVGSSVSWASTLEVFSVADRASVWGEGGSSWLSTSLLGCSLEGNPVGFSQLDSDVRKKI